MSLSLEGGVSDSDTENTSLDEMDDLPPWPISEWRMHYPYWEQPDILARRVMGESYVMVANAVITLGQPYPGDDQYQEIQRPDDRFLVERRGLAFTIHDSLTNEKLSVDWELLTNSHFNLSRWYALKRTQALNMDRAMDSTYNGTMGQALSKVARKLLTDGIHTYYPCMRPDQNPYTRFNVCQCVVIKDEYLITDKDLRLHVRISRTLLENPTFDLVGWYIKYLSQHELATSQIANEIEPEKHCCSSSHVYVGCSQPKPLGAAEASASDPEDSVDDDLPNLQSPEDSDESESEDACEGYVSDDDFEDSNLDEDYPNGADLVSALESLIAKVLTGCQPFPGDGPAVDPTYRDGDG
jgi:hypothetical protein